VSVTSHKFTAYEQYLLGMLVRSQVLELCRDWLSVRVYVKI